MVGSWLDYGLHKCDVYIEHKKKIIYTVVKPGVVDGAVVVGGSG